MDFKDLKIEDYTYILPKDKIALFPREKRSTSKLLKYQNEHITHHSFNEIVDLVPKNSLIFFNNTKVIQARLLFNKNNGVKIEIFLISPHQPLQTEFVMLSKEKCQWVCLIKKSRKWKNDEILKLQIDGNEYLNAKRIDENIIEFEWYNGLKFYEVVEKIGNTPLPPYINRKLDINDKNRYQTVYSKIDGAVAAPTAGLHFTDEIIDNLKKNNGIDFVTLHVSAGTFKPISTTIEEHPMHSEEIIITKENILNLLNNNNNVVAVGTTVVRTLESLYWFGVKLLENKIEFVIEKFVGYKKNTNPTKMESLQAVLKYFEQKKVNIISLKTEILILPPYSYKICDILITNFHQPESTLLLLVSAFIGKDWKKVYQAALEEDYRFLSFGDSCVFFRKKFEY